MSSRSKEQGSELVIAVLAAVVSVICGLIAAFFAFMQQGMDCTKSDDCKLNLLGNFSTAKYIFLMLAAGAAVLALLSAVKHMKKVHK